MQPEIQVLVDWNDDGDFSDANEDITSDVLELSFDHHRDLMTEYMNGAVLDLTLKNAGHKYSPPNASSPLSGDLVPGRNVWVRMWYPYDAFEGSWGTFLEDHSPNRDSSFSWTSNTLNRFRLDGAGAAVNLGGWFGKSFVDTLDFSESDLTVAAWCKRSVPGPGYEIGFVVRLVNSSNYAYIQFDGSNCELRKVISGSDSQVSTNSYSWTANTIKFVEVELHGTSLRVIVDSVEALDATLDDAAINSGTEFGLYQADQPALPSGHEFYHFGGYRSLLRGKLGHLRPRPGKKGQQYCYLKCFDGFESFKNDRLTTVNVGSFPATGDDSFGTILDSVDWPSADRQMDTGTTMTNDLPEGVKALSDKALATIYELQDEEDGLMYIDGDGFARYESRDHRDNAPHDASNATYKDTYDGTNPGFTDLSWEDGTDGVENHILVKYLRATDAGTIVVWSSSQAQDTSLAIPLAASETMNFIVESKDYDAFHSVTVPVATTDYTVNTQADGLGTDKTGSVTVTHQNSGTILGRFAHIRVVNNDASAYFITKLQLRAKGLRYEDQMAMEAVDSTSQSQHGERRKVIDCLFIDREQGAQDLADNRLARRKDPKTVVDLTLAAGDKPTLMAMVHRRLSDRVTVNYSDMGIDEDFFIEGESWRLTDGGTSVQQVLQLRGV